MLLRGAILSWIVLIITNTVVNGIRIQHPTICVKANPNLFNGSHESIKIAANNFKDFVRHSDIFVDKSSLIANLLTNNVSLVSLTYPEKWGKSINLNMLKTFLELEIDSKAKAMPPKTTWSFKFFKNGEIMYENGTSAKLMHPPMISRNEQVMRSYLARYPVIYLNLSSFNPISQDFTGFFKSFQKRIADTFMQHDYLVEVFRDQLDDCESIGCDRQSVKNRIGKFRSYITGEKNSPDDVVTSLVFLSEILKSHFNQSVYVLIDDYDAIIKKSYLEAPSPTDGETEQIREFYERFITLTFAKNENLQMGIVTGIFDLDVFSDHTSSFASINYNLLNKNTPPFYGFTVTEIKHLLSQLSYDKEFIKEAMEYYYGYRIGDFLEMVIYDPWLIVNFVNTGKLANYRCGMGESEISSLTSRCTAAQLLLDNTILGGSEGTELHFRNLTFRKENLVSLKNLINNANFPPDSDDLGNSVLAYFYAKGYFTLHTPMVFGSRVMSVKIDFANRNIRSDSSRGYLSELQNDVTPHVVGEMAGFLFNIFWHRGYKELDYSDCEVWEECHKKCKIIHRNQQFASLHDFHSLHLAVMMHMKSKFNFDTNFNALYHINEQVLRPYIVLETNDRRAIIEFCCTQWGGRVEDLAKDSINRAKQFNIIFKDKPFKNTSFIGIGISSATSESNCVSLIDLALIVDTT